MAKYREQSIQNELLVSEWRKACNLSERALAEVQTIQKALESVTSPVYVLTHRSPNLLLASLEQARANNLSEQLSNLRLQKGASETATIPTSLANTSYEQLRTNYERLRDRCLVLEQYRMEHLEQSQHSQSASDAASVAAHSVANGRSASGSSAVSDT